jgi:hypothetical protein
MGDYNGNSFRSGLSEVGKRGDPEIVDQVHHLTIIPPSEPIDINSELEKSVPSLLDLGLKTPMSKHEGTGMVDHHLHCGFNNGWLGFMKLPDWFD